MRFDRDDPSYPARLRELPDPPKILTTTGPLDPAPRVVAIVGSRRAAPGSAAFAYTLAYALARAGIVVVSGGAVGVDAAAHRGALAAGGRTWAVLPCGRATCSPPKNRRLFQAISVAPGGRLLFPLPDHVGLGDERYRYRNGVLTALADDVVVVQAHFQSGSLNAAGWARSLRRRIWMVPAAPWMTGYCGTNAWLRLGLARPIWSPTELLTTLVGRPVPWPSEVRYALDPSAVTDALAPFLDKEATVEEGAPAGARPPREPRSRTARARHSTGSRKRSGTPSTPPLPGLRTESETRVLSTLSSTPLPLDAIAVRAALPVSATVTALLTLALEDVVVEGPDGFFRLQIAG